MNIDAPSPVAVRLRDGSIDHSHFHLQMEVTAELLHHQKGKPFHLLVFMRRQQQRFSQLHANETSKIGQALLVDCFVPKRAAADEELYFWLFTERKIRGDEPFDDESKKESQPVAGRARVTAGAATLSVGRGEMPAIRKYA